MKRYLAVYKGTAAARPQWEDLSESKRKELEARGMKAWTDWTAKNEEAIEDRERRSVRPSVRPSRESTPVAAVRCGLAHIKRDTASNTALEPAPGLGRGALRAHHPLSTRSTRRGAMTSSVRTP